MGRVAPNFQLPCFNVVQRGFLTFLAGAMARLTAAATAAPIIWPAVAWKWMPSDPTVAVEPRSTNGNASCAARRLYAAMVCFDFGPHPLNPHCVVGHGGR